MSVFQRISRTVGFIYTVQLGAAAVFVPLKTEVSSLSSTTIVVVARLTTGSRNRIRNSTISWAALDSFLLEPYPFTIPGFKLAGGEKKRPSPRYLRTLLDSSWSRDV
jgi:hypothetical protein